MNKNTENTLFDKVGRDIIAMAVEAFYEKVFGDNEIKHFYEGLDLQKQKNRQRAFLIHLFGGPTKYAGKDVELIPAGFVEKGINEAQRKIITNHFSQSFKDLSVKDKIVIEIMNLADKSKVSNKLDERIETVKSKNIEPIKRTNKKSIYLDEQGKELNYLKPLVDNNINMVFKPSLRKMTKRIVITIEGDLRIKSISMVKERLDIIFDKYDFVDVKLKNIIQFDLSFIQLFYVLKSYHQRNNKQLSLTAELSKEIKNLIISSGFWHFFNPKNIQINN
jgi:hemoglobin